MVCARSDAVEIVIDAYNDRQPCDYPIHADLLASPAVPWPRHLQPFQEELFGDVDVELVGEVVDARIKPVFGTGSAIGPARVFGDALELHHIEGRIQPPLAKQQRTLVTDDDIGPLLSLLADRQKLSERLVLLGTRLLPIRRDWARYRQQLSSTVREEADRCLGEASAALQRVLDRDAQDARVLSGRKHSVAAALGNTQSTRAAISAYRANSAAVGRLDCTDEGTS